MVPLTGVLWWLFSHAKQVQLALLIIYVAGGVLLTVGLFGATAHRLRADWQLVDQVQEDVRRAELLEERNRLQDRDLFAVAAHVDGEEWRP